MPQSATRPIGRPTGSPPTIGYARAPGRTGGVRTSRDRIHAGAIYMTGTTDKLARRTPRPSPADASRPVTGRAPDHAAEPARSQQLRTDQLLAAVESELIPRLLVSHSTEVDAAGAAARDGGAPVSGPWASPPEIARFARLCVEDTSDLLNRHVSKLLTRDVGLDAVYLHLIAPAARRLGDWWSSDEMSFVDVQLGLCRLHQLVCECGPIGQRHDAEGDSFSILLSTVPGDQHTFGVTLAADFFRRRGWQVSNLAGLDRDFLLDRVAGSDYSAIGFSLHNDEFAARLPGLIRTVRERSLNPGVLVLVGGDYFARHPEEVALVGADLGADDAHQAVAIAESRLRAAGRAG